MKKDFTYLLSSFSTGEARPLRGTSRREIGHGNLAQRALKNVIQIMSIYSKGCFRSFRI